MAKRYSIPELIYILDNKTGNESMTKDEVFKYMVHQAKEKSKAIEEENNFYENILAREKIENTYMGFGIGLPHSRCDGVKKIMVSVVLLKNPLVYNDKGERVNLVVMI
ncbi:MAG: PTS sugar transporter subunit IIA, partial [Fusobacteriaceae bacterium]